MPGQEGWALKPGKHELMHNHADVLLSWIGSEINDNCCHMPCCTINKWFEFMLTNYIYIENHREIYHQVKQKVLNKWDILLVCCLHFIIVIFIFSSITVIFHQILLILVWLWFLIPLLWVHMHSIISYYISFSACLIHS